MSQSVAPGSVAAFAGPSANPVVPIEGGEQWANDAIGGNASISSVDSASTGVLLNNLPAAFTLSAHLQSRFSQAPPVYALDGNLVKELLVTLADTVSSQVSTLYAY